MKNQFIGSILLALGIATFPLYILPSGLPQISHFIFLFYSLVILYMRKSIPRLTGLAVLPIFVYYVMLRQTFFAMEMQEEVITAAIYLVFNSLFFTCLLSSIRDNPKIVLRFVTYGAFISLIVVAFGVVIFGFSFIAAEDISHRAVGTFKNPNQLGYYSICLFGIVAVLSTKGYVPKIFLICTYISCLFLAVLSLSKAAMISMILYILIIFGKRVLFKFILTLVVLVTICFTVPRGTFEEYKFYQRISNIGSDNDDSLESRGYGVLFNPDFRILYGWGEGYVKELIGHETHSTLGNVLISYGLLGLGLFIILLMIILRRIIWCVGLLPAFGYMAPTMFYGLTHNGIRFSIFWLYLAILYSMKMPNDTTTGHYNKLSIGQHN